MVTTVALVNDSGSDYVYIPVVVTVVVALLALMLRWIMRPGARPGARVADPSQGLLIGVLATSPQEAERVRRIGVLIAAATDDPEFQTRVAAFLQGLQQLGWTDGRNVRVVVPRPDGNRKCKSPVMAVTRFTICRLEPRFADPAQVSAVAVTTELLITSNKFRKLQSIEPHSMGGK